MHFLILHVILISGFGLFLKDAKNRGHRLIPIGFMNYLAALLISLWAAAHTGSFEFTRLTFAFGLTNGFTYSTGFLLVALGMRSSGIVVTMAVVRLSVVVPIVFAILLWNETPNQWQVLGVLLTCCALPILGTTSSASPVGKGAGEFGLNALSGAGQKKFPAALIGRETTALGLLILGMLFINSGGSRLAMKAFNEMCPVDQKLMYLCFVFAVATIAYTGACIYRKTLPTRWEAFYGLLIGICNMSGSSAFLAALDRVDALIAFPVSSSGGVLFTTLVGTLLLGERLNRKSIIGGVMAVVALILVNLKSV